MVATKGIMSTQAQSTGSSASPELRTETNRGTRFGWLRTFAAWVASILGGLVVLLAVGNAFPAATNIVTLGATMAWASFAPHLVLISVIAAVLCVPLWRAKRRPVLRGIASGLAAVALVASSAITATLVNTATGNGGSVDLLSSLTITNSPDAPTEITSYLAGDGSRQEVRIY